MDQTTHEVRLANWKAIIEQCQARPKGQIAKDWMVENDISDKQYYYWLRRVRAAVIEKTQIPALPEPEKLLPNVSFAEIPMKEVLSTEESPVIVIKTRKSTIEISTAISDIDCNFVHFDKQEDSLKRNERIKYYYLFQEYKNRSRKTIWSVLDRGIIEIQKRIGIDRRRHFQGEFKVGSQWWSIKQDLAEYIVSKRDNIKKHFMFTMSDEMFVQTLVYNSSFYDMLFMGELNDQHVNQLLIDFGRGHPYLWTIKDVEEIMRSDLLFARKFDEVIDSEVIDVITKFCTNIV